MKKIPIAIIVGILSMMATTKNVEAQANDLMAKLSIFKNETSSAFNKPTSENNHYISGEPVHARALKNFEKEYKNADPKWILSDEGITATFKENNTRYVVYYNKKGHWTGSIKAYPENLLEKDIRTMVKREYFDYKINGVKELEYVGYGPPPTYIVIIENEHSIKWIRINDGLMNVVKEFYTQ